MRLDDVSIFFVLKVLYTKSELKREDKVGFAGRDIFKKSNVKSHVLSLVY